MDVVQRADCGRHRPPAARVAAGCRVAQEGGGLVGVLGGSTGCEGGGVMSFWDALFAWIVIVSCVLVMIGPNRPNGRGDERR